MGYKRKIFNDKTIVAAAAVGVLAISAILGGTYLNDQSNKDNGTIVELSEETTIGGTDVAENTEDESGIVVSDQDGVTAIQSDEDGNKDADDAADVGNEGEEMDNAVAESEAGDEEDQDADAASGLVGQAFTMSSTLVWPVEGNVLIEYDMENTVYFATLDLYKCSDAVCIQSEVGTPVYAGYECVVEEIDYNSEIGNNVTVSMGNGYVLTYGQLKDVQIEKGTVLEEGDLIGYVGEPTKYYSVEGANLYMKMTLDGAAIDPLDYLDYE